jgi:hypothetical protein
LVILYFCNVSCEANIKIPPSEIIAGIGSRPAAEPKTAFRAYRNFIRPKPSTPIGVSFSMSAFI